MRYALYITDTQLKIYPEKISDEMPVQTFGWRPDKALIDQFIFQLSEKDEVFIILDLIDEELNFEWSPKVLPWEKAPLLKRRMERAHADNNALVEIRANQASRSNKEGRKEELLLTATVADGFNLTNWLAKLESANVLLQAIYSKPFLMKHFFETNASKLDISGKFSKFPLLITSRQSEHHYRQTFVFEGNLRLSRLVELDSSLHSFDEIQDALLNETRMAVSYVYNQKILPFKAPFAMLFLDSDAGVINELQDIALRRQLISSEWQNDEYFFATALFRDLIRSKGHCSKHLETQSCYSEQAMVDYVFSETPKGFYQTGYTKKIQNIFLGRKLFVSTNVLLALGLVGYLLINSVDSYLKWQELGMLDERITAHQTEKKRLESLVQLKDDAQTIKSSVEFSESILKLKLGRLVGFDIQSLSETLVKHNNIQISDIKWSNKERFDSKTHEISFNGWVFPFYGTYKKPVEWVDNLVSDLEKVSGVQSVQLTKEPLNRNLNQAVTVNTDEGKVPALAFSITLRMKDGESK
ncbi:hypothetical protein [Thiomicrorhabdus indica]|uniref:hypothetical protein n=1 Tax=Thiomicrorhabdus indica TaxID=2267253 RepID=UPI002AA7F167|nr:hypothetical protein [Thiomicrorhabdus indica]